MNWDAFIWNRTFPDEVSTICYENITPDLAEKAIRDAIKKGCNIVFTTAPEFVQASVQAAIDNPDVRILNCSLNTSPQVHKDILCPHARGEIPYGRHCRSHVGERTAGIYRGLSIFGTIANINAFALGAKLINPRAKVYLEWSSLKDADLGKVMDGLAEKGVSIVSGRDMVIPEDASPLFRPLPHGERYAP